MSIIMNLKKYKNLSRVFLIVLLFLSLSACSISTKTDGLQISSSVFLSLNNGNSWADASAITNITNTTEKIADIDVNGIYSDPNDSLAVYLATSNGLYQTYNVKKGWTKVEALPDALVRSVAVSPSNKCLIYVAMANKLYYSNDCNRSFKETYYDNDKTATVNTIAIDHYNSNNIYLGTSRGEIIKSIDGGLSWRTIHRLDSSISKILLNPQDSRLVFVVTNEAKLFSFLSNTKTDASKSEDINNNFVVNDFKDLNRVLSDLKIGDKFEDLVVSKSDGTLLLASDKMILRSVDNGVSWENLNLIQPDGEVRVNALAVSPKNSKEIYYVTNTTFFRSADGGVTWATKGLPSNRGGSALLVDSTFTKNIYLANYKIVK